MPPARRQISLFRITAVIIFLGLWPVGAARAFTTVIIDAGHGGKDPGCHWNGLVERVLCLDVARRLNTILQARDLKTVMTRTSDVYVELSERAAIANRYSDAIFVSIHFNASRDHSISGIEVHHRSKAGLVLAGCIKEGMSKAVKGRLRDGDWQDYKVLRETHATAVLVECGFISHPGEAARCADPDHRRALAQGIAKGILAAKTKL